MGFRGLQALDDNLIRQDGRFIVTIL